MNEYSPRTIFLLPLLRSKIKINPNTYYDLVVSDYRYLKLHNKIYNNDHLFLVYRINGYTKATMNELKRIYPNLMYYVDSLRNPQHYLIRIDIDDSREQEIILNYLNSRFTNLYKEEELTKYKIPTKTKTMFTQVNSGVKTPLLNERLNFNFGVKHNSYQSQVNFELLDESWYVLVPYQFQYGLECLSSNPEERSFQLENRDFNFLGKYQHNKQKLLN